MARSRLDDEDDDTPNKKPRRPVEDDEEEDVRPKAKKKPAKPIDDDDEDDEDDAPPPKKKPAVKAAAKRRDADDEDNEDDEEEAPRKKSKYKVKAKKKGGLPKPLLIGGAIALMLLLCGGGGFAGYHFLFGDTPKTAYAKFQKDVAENKWSAVYDDIDKSSQGIILAKQDATVPSGRTGKDLFIMLVNSSGEGPTIKTIFVTLASAKVDVVEVTGDTAVLQLTVDTSRVPAGSRSTYPHGGKLGLRLVKEDGKWKICIL